MMESLRIVERGEATPQDVDVAMKLGAGFPMGPFELADVSRFQLICLLPYFGTFFFFIVSESPIIKLTRSLFFVGHAPPFYSSLVWIP